MSSSGRLRVVHMTCVHAVDDVRILRKFAVSQAAYGWETHVVALGEGPMMEMEAGACLHRLPRTKRGGRVGRASLGAWRVYRGAMRLKPDVILAHDPELIPFLGLARLSGVHTVFDSHEDFVLQSAFKTWVRGWRRMLVLTIARALRALTPWAATHIFATTEGVAAGYPAAKTTIIRNYPVIGELGTGDPEGMATRPKRVVYIGGLSKLRGIEEVVDAAALCNVLEGVDLAGPIAPEFLAMLREKPGWAKVRYHGMLDRTGVAALLGQSRGGLVSLHATPNHLHAIPLKMLEYYSTGLPVIVSNFKEWDYLMVEGAVLRVNPQNPASVAGAMAALCDDETVTRMARAVAAGPMHHYDWETQSRLAIAAIERLAQAKSRIS